MFGDRLGEFSGDSIEHLVPRYPQPADFVMEDAAVEVERFGERRALGTQTPEVCRMVGIALDGDGAFVIDAGNHAAADAAIGTGGPGFNGHGRPLGGMGGSVCRYPPLSALPTSPPQGGRSTRGRRLARTRCQNMRMQRPD